MVICWRFSCIDCSFERICYFSIQDPCHSFHSGHSTTFQKFTQICFIWNLYFASLKFLFRFFFGWCFFLQNFKSSKLWDLSWHHFLCMWFFGMKEFPTTPVIPVTRGGETAAWQRMESWLHSGLHRYKHTFRHLQGEMSGVIWGCATFMVERKNVCFPMFILFGVWKCQVSRVEKGWNRWFLLWNWLWFIQGYMFIESEIRL